MVATAADEQDSWLCVAGAFVNALALMLMVTPLLNLLLTSHPSAGYRAAKGILLAFTAPIVIECFALLAVLGWRMRPH